MQQTKLGFSAVALSCLAAIFETRSFAGGVEILFVYNERDYREA